MDRYVIGPTQAWTELKRLGFVKEAAFQTAPDRGWVHGHVRCRERPRLKPPRVVFRPDIPSDEQAYVEHNEGWTTMQRVFKVPDGSVPT